MTAAGFPEFFDTVPGIVMYDPLAEFLGAAPGGLLEYRYHDAVRLAGHSCPTVAAAWTMTRRALRALYPDGTPLRGGVRVMFRDGATQGVTGVMASVVTLVTGATMDTGFKGLAGRFDRRRLLAFQGDQKAEMVFTRLDTGLSVEAGVDLRGVAAAPEMATLMAACLDGRASESEKSEFRQIWQERVRVILLHHADDDAVFPLKIREN